MSATPSSTASIVDRLRQERLRLGWTQADLAMYAGMSAIMYRRFERSGRISLARLLKVAAALGFDLELTGSGASAVGALDSRVVRVRQRGLRHARPQPAAAPAAPAASTPPARRPVAAPDGASPSAVAPAPARPPVDAAAIAEVQKRFREEIRLLVRAIVFNRLTNYTARAAVQNTMRANRVGEGTKPAFVAAVEAELGRLDAKNCTALGIDPPHLDLWAGAWDPKLGIVGALE